MSHVGQCPACHTLYELDDEDIGRSLECDCGASLFACNVDAFPEFPIHCHQCGEQYVVDQEDAGAQVECECGATITVPTIVLRAPLSSPGKSVDAIVAEASKGSEEPTGGPMVACPRCSTEYSVSEEDLDQESECECGCVFTTVRGPQGKLFARESEDSAATDAARDDHAQPERSHKKKTSWLSIVGVGSVAALLIFSVVMFIRRDTGVPAAKKNDSTKTAAVDAASGLSSTALATVRGDSVTPKPSAAPKPASDSELSFNSIEMPREPESYATDALVNVSLAENNDTSGGTPAAWKLPPLAEKPLPKAMAPRPRIALIPESGKGLTFERAYDTAFELYRETMELKEVAEVKNDEAEMAVYHESLGKTLGLLQETHDIGMRQQSNDKINELRYFLTYMYFNAGQLAEASILGEAVARWGEKSDPSTLESTMLALAACQEASATQWGSAERVGELDQMRAIAKVVAKRWPDHAQLEDIWMNLAQLYDAFSMFDRAGDIYAKLPKKSKYYTGAQLAAGTAYWTEYRRLMPDEGDPSPELEGLKNKARKHLRNGVDSLQEGEPKPSVPLLTTKLSLARIEMVSGNPEEAEAWLTEAPLPLTQSVTLETSTRNKIKMPPSFVRSVFETLFAARSQLQNTTGAKAALEQMARVLGSDVVSEVGDKMLSVMTNYMRELKGSSRVSDKQVKTLKQLLTSLKQKSGPLSASSTLWVGESWSEIAARAETPELSVDCYARAAAAYATAMKLPDFPKASVSSALLRQAQLLRSAGKVDEALADIEKVLAKTPNVFGLQIEAAATLQDMAIADADPQRLVDAANGPTDSPIWGWSRLVSTLHAIRFSPSGTEKHAEQLPQCQYQLARCRWLIAQATVDPGEKAKKSADVKRMVDRLVQTTAKDHQPWYDRLKSLQADMSSI